MEQGCSLVGVCVCVAERERDMDQWIQWPSGGERILGLKY